MGEQSKWEKMSERFTIVGGVLMLVEKNGEILMLLRKNKFDEGLYSLVGGCMEEGETVLQAAVRELGEEADLTADEKNMKVVSALHRICPEGSWTSVEFVVAVKGFSGEPKIMEPDKSSELRWFKPSELPANISRYAKQAIENYINDVRFSQIDF